MSDIDERTQGDRPALDSITCSLLNRSQVYRNQQREHGRKLGNRGVEIEELKVTDETEDGYGEGNGENEIYPEGFHHQPSAKCSFPAAHNGVYWKGLQTPDTIWLCPQPHSKVSASSDSSSASNMSESGSTQHSKPSVVRGNRELIYITGPHPLNAEPPIDRLMEAEQQLLSDLQKKWLNDSSCNTSLSENTGTVGETSKSLEIIPRPTRWHFVRTHGTVPREETAGMNPETYTLDLKIIRDSGQGKIREGQNQEYNKPGAAMLGENKSSYGMKDAKAEEDSSTSTHRAAQQSHECGAGRETDAPALLRSVSLSLPEIYDMPSIAIPVTIMCDGNRRKEMQSFQNAPSISSALSLFAPSQTPNSRLKGIPFGPGAISTALWTGVPLWYLLHKCLKIPVLSEITMMQMLCRNVDKKRTPSVMKTKDFLALQTIQPGAGEVGDTSAIASAGESASQSTSPAASLEPPWWRYHVCFEGADELAHGKYGTSIPLLYAMDPTRDCLVATQMNGTAIPPDHGYPLRLILPGMVGGRMIKWLKKITLSVSPSPSFYQWNDNLYPLAPPSLCAGTDASLSPGPVAVQEEDFQCYEPNVNSVISHPGMDESWKELVVKEFPSIPQTHSRENSTTNIDQKNTNQSADSATEQNQQQQIRDEKSKEPVIRNLNRDTTTKIACVSAKSSPKEPQCRPQKNESDGLLEETLRGYAYSGGGRKVVRVEITLDDGKTWIPCKITHYPPNPIFGSSETIGPSALVRRCWTLCLWSVQIETWRLLTASEIAVRAIDSAFNTQPPFPTVSLEEEKADKASAPLHRRRQEKGPIATLNNAWYRVKIEIKKFEKTEPGAPHSTPDKGGNSLRPWIRFIHPVHPGSGCGGWMLSPFATTPGGPSACSFPSIDMPSTWSFSTRSSCPASAFPKSGEDVSAVHPLRRTAFTMEEVASYSRTLQGESVSSEQEKLVTYDDDDVPVAHIKEGEHDSKCLGIGNFRQASNMREGLIVIDGAVIDVSFFLSSRTGHPGGQDAIDVFRGRDASTAFHDVHHSQEALQMLRWFQVGVLAMKGLPSLTKQEDKLQAEERVNFLLDPSLWREAIILEKRYRTRDVLFLRLKLLKPPSGHGGFDRKARSSAGKKQTEIPSVCRKGQSESGTDTTRKILHKSAVCTNRRVGCFEPQPNALQMQSCGDIEAQTWRIGLPVGQHILLRTVIDGEMVVRPYTPISPIGWLGDEPDDDEALKGPEARGVIDLLVKVYRDKPGVNGGLMSQFLENLPVSTSPAKCPIPAPTVLVKGPCGGVQYCGNGYFLLPSSPPSSASTGGGGGASRLVRAECVNFVGGGTGITPLYQLLVALLSEAGGGVRQKQQLNEVTGSGEDLSEQHWDCESLRIAMLYANTREEDILLRDELCALSAAYPKQFSLWFTVSSTPMEAHGMWRYGEGHVNVRMMSRHLFRATSGALCFVCGPEGLIRYAVVPSMEELGFDDSSLIEF